MGPADARICRMSANRTGFPTALCIAALLAASSAARAEPAREETLAFFLEQAGAASATNAAPASLEPMLAALEAIAAKKPDEPLLRALFEYQATHPGAQDPRPALAMGRLYWAQPKAFRAAFRSLDAAQQRRVMPYVEFGWKECIRPKNKSDRWLRQLQQELDRLSAGMVNAR